MKTDVFREPESPLLNGAALDLDIDPAAVQLRQADIAKLFGITRQRVCQMVSRGLISTQPNGRINPSQAAKELIGTDVKTARAKVLIDIRRQVDSANARAAQAEAKNRVLIEKNKSLLAIINDLARAYYEFAWAFNAANLTLQGKFDPAVIDDVFDAAYTTALNSPDDFLNRRADPDIKMLLDSI
jgi:hypothetical protein